MTLSLPYSGKRGNSVVGAGIAQYLQVQKHLLDRASLLARAVTQPYTPSLLHSNCCGAKTRKGTPCKSKVLYRGGRCKLHGGFSTGPKTKRGKAASRRNGKKGGRPKKNRQVTPKTDT